MKNPLNIKEIIFENIKYIPMKNGKSIMLRYLNNEKFFFQTPELVIKNIESKNDMSIIYFDLNENLENISIFINFLINLDKSIVKTARLNRKWFSSNNIKFKGLIRYDEFNSPYFKLKFKNSYIEKLRITSNRQTEKCFFSDLKKNSKVKMIIDVNGLWINENYFGIYLKPLLFDIRETYDLILNESSEDDILDTDVLEKTCSSINFNNCDNLKEINNEIEDLFSVSSENKSSILNSNSSINSSVSDKYISNENEVKYD